MIRKLSQEIVNQIAAGEVIERPSSVVKELLDNAIDAGSDRIDIKIKNGGISYIEVSDNGVGIDKDDMEKAFQAHATSKIENLDDLNEILTMGFRGEALSTIVSVSSVTLISKNQKGDFAYKVKGQGIDISDPEKCPRDQGTTVIVENLFKEIPARFKYLRTESTEYRKMLEILIPYFLSYPNIHFNLSHNNKKLYNLPKTDKLVNRIPQVLRGDFTSDMLSVFFDGEGIKITGYIAKPEHNFTKTLHQYIFINKRPIQDRGIIRAVSEGFSGFVPEGKKVPFIINLQIKTSLVDVNVHPKKEEVRFINPYRLYSAVEEAVKQALKEHSIKHVSPSVFTTSKSSKKLNDKSTEINYKKQSSYNVNSGLKFSEHLLKNQSEDKIKSTKVKIQDNLFSNQTNEDIDVDRRHNLQQIFNKFIIAEFEDEVWILDQHAASERIYYEKIRKEFQSSSVETQKLLIPLEVSLSDLEILFIKENKEIFDEFGFKFDINDSVIEIIEVPTILVNTDFERFFKDLISESEIKKDIEKFKENIILLIACHASIRAGQKLTEQEMRHIVLNLRNCENATTCPHGRPIIWKITEKELNKKFQRT